MTRKRKTTTSKAPKGAKDEMESPEKKLKIMENLSNQDESDEENQQVQNHNKTNAIRQRAVKEKLTIKIDASKNLRPKRNVKKGKDAVNEGTSVELKENENMSTDSNSSSTMNQDASKEVQNLQKNVTYLMSQQTDKSSNELSVQNESDPMKTSDGSDNQIPNEPLVLNNEKNENLDIVLMGLEDDTPVEISENNIVLFLEGAEDYAILPMQSVVNNSNFEKIYQVIENEENMENQSIENVENENLKNQDIANFENQTMENVENKDIGNMENYDIGNVENQSNQSISADQDKTTEYFPLPQKIDDNIMIKAAKKLKSKTKAKKTKVKGKSKHRRKELVQTELAPMVPLVQNIINEQDEIICKLCEQKIDSNLCYHNGEPIGGFEEGTAILDSKLLLFHGGEAKVSIEDTRSYNKITSFSVYCQNGHLCHFDSGLIEKDVELYFSGFIKPIHSDNTLLEDSVPGKRFGPIASWWMTGFDIGEQPTVGLSTELGDYICMEPSAEYTPFMKSVTMKIYISKIIIEFLIYEPNASYEDLLRKLQTTPVPNNLMKNFTEDTLLHYASFICDQVISFDDTAKPKELLMVRAPCIRRLIDLAGIRFEVDTSKLPQKGKQMFRERQFEHKTDYREKLLRQVAKEKEENASANELIDILLPTYEKSLISHIIEPWRCGVCERCLRSRCRVCKACSARKPCYQRRCFNREIMEENEEDAQDEVDFSEMKAEDSFTLYRTAVHPLARHTYDIAWGTKPLWQDQKRTYYGSIYVDCQLISPGDFIDVRSVNFGVPPQIMKVAYMYEDETGFARIHACFLWSGKYTVLGDISDRQELFFINKCIDVSAKCFVKKVQVFERTSNNLDSSITEEQLQYSYVCQRSYDPLSGTFHDLQPHDKEAREKYGALYRYCWVCDRNNVNRAKNTPKPFNMIDESADKITYKSVLYKTEEYHIGSAVYLKPKSLYFTYPMLNNVGQKHIHTREVDEDKHSEIYRKAKDEDAKSNEDVPAPFDIGYITKVFTSEGKLFLNVRKLYRPENTHKGDSMSNIADVNVLYWSDEHKVVPFNYVVGKCYVTHLSSITNAEEWSRQGPDRFFFSQIYKDNAIINISKWEYDCPIKMCEAPLYPNVMLKSLNIFAGCGGLSLGLRQAGAAECKWAIEPDKAAAATFKLNNPDAVVFVGTCVEMMEKVSKKDFKLNDFLLPKKGDVDLLCATLPPESWRSINSVNAFKHSNIATFLVYLEYYQPQFFVLEADDVVLKRSIVLKLALSSFIRLGYQVAFDLLQVGHFGAPQDHCRTIIIGAARGQALPDCPKIQHVFSKSSCHGYIVIDNRMYQRRNWTESAPYRATLVRDAILDLATLDVNQDEEVIKYTTQSVSFYQRMMRYDLTELNKTKVFNHVSKDLGPLAHARMSQIPTLAGSDWRDLPNIEIQLRDKTITNKLIYLYDDPELGKGKQGQPRGVCNCSVGKRCEPSDVQENTLIPWYLVHSGKRHGHWAGLYGKLQWNSVFVGISTNPEPLAKKAPVIHPSKSRVLSVRECARAQGFPDSFVFAGGFPVHEMYRQIGLSTSPLLARAIGYEIAKSASLNVSQ